MPEFKWNIQTPEEHLVEVQHAVHCGRVRIKVDGTVVFAQDGPYALWDSGLSHDLTIDGTKWRMETRGIGTLNPEYILRRTQSSI